MNPTLGEIAAPGPQDWLERVRAGDAEAFSELCRVYETRLLRQAAVLCDSATLAEDLAQDALVEAWRCLHRHNGRCRFFTWLCAILLNRHRSVLRSRRRRWGPASAGRDGDEQDGSLDQSADDHAWPDQVAQLRDQAALVRRCVQALPRKHQEVIHLRFYVDDSLEGIAAALGCSVGTVKSRLFHALDRLRRMRALRGESATFETNPTTS